MLRLTDGNSGPGVVQDRYCVRLQRLRYFILREPSAKELAMRAELPIAMALLILFTSFSYSQDCDAQYAACLSEVEMQQDSCFARCGNFTPDPSQQATYSQCRSQCTGSYSRGQCYSLYCGRASATRRISKSRMPLTEKGIFLPRNYKRHAMRRHQKAHRAPTAHHVVYRRR